MLEESKDAERNSESEGNAEFADASDNLEHVKKVRDALEVRYRQERIEQSVPRTSVELMASAKKPDENDPVRPNVLLNMILSILLGLASGVALAYFVEYVDTSIKTVEDVERFMKLPVLGVIPQRVKAFVEKGAEGAHAEAYRMLRTSIEVSEKFKGGKTLCITSGSVGEGKSLTVFNLGYVCAQLGDRVLIVDSDMHRPRQHKILGVPNKPGLANILIGESSFDKSVVKTPLENLHLLPSGRLSSGAVHGLLDTRRMKELVQEVRERYDLVIFDAPPVIGVSDTSLLVREVDGVVQVIQHRKYPRSVSSRAKDMIEMVGGRLMGVVLNNINVARDYSYYYHYHYYYPRDKSQNAAS
jgi:capsular exopolysaccharide synthesis family protein